MPTTNPRKPKAWPSNIPYLTAPVRSPKLTPPQLASLRQPPPTPYFPNDPSIIPHAQQQHPSAAVQIRPITTPTHPAHGQSGLFATRHLPAGSLILPYLGYVHPTSSESASATASSEANADPTSNDPNPATSDDTDPTSDYDVALDRDAGVAVDAARMGNEARFVNDYRGVRGAGPNAEFRDCWLEVPASSAPSAAVLAVAAGSNGKGKGGGGASGAGKKVLERCVGVFVLGAGKSGKRSKGIAKGEEILVSYGRGFWRERLGVGFGESGAREEGEEEEAVVADVYVDGEEQGG